MTNNRKKTQKHVGLGFTYTRYDELRIRKECESAALYMRSYGKGRQPFMVDTSRHEAGIEPDNDSDDGND